MAGYTRQSVADIVNGNDITAPPHNAEYNQIQQAFDGSTGHGHTGGTGDGPKINLTTSVVGILPAALGGGAKHNLAATTPPTASSDTNAGYSVGSNWIDISTDTIYVCVDATNSGAIWCTVASKLYVDSLITTNETIQTDTEDARDAAIAAQAASETAQGLSEDARDSAIAAANTAAVDAVNDAEVLLAGYVTDAETAETNAAASAGAASTSETNASTSETNAGNSASAASTSEANAAASEALAEKWSSEAEDVEVTTGKYSAHHWAQKAEGIVTVGDIGDTLKTARVPGSSWLDLSASLVVLVSDYPILATLLPSYLDDEWDISTAEYVQTFVFTQGGIAPQGLFFTDDGTTLYVSQYNTRTIDQYTLSTAWNVSTAVYQQSLDVSPNGIYPNGIALSSDGTDLYVVSVTSVYQYSLSTAWDISTASYVQSFSVGATLYSTMFNSDGTKLIATGRGVIYQYNLGTGWDISTATLVNSYDTGIIHTDDSKLNQDGTKLFISSNDPNSGGSVKEFSLSIAWDVTTISFVRALSTTNEEDDAQGLAFKPDGSKMYVSGHITDGVVEYNLGNDYIDLPSIAVDQGLKTYIKAE